MNEDIQNKDRILPDQPFMKMFYQGENFFGALDGLLKAGCRVESVEKRFHIALPEGRTYASLGTEISTLCFYQLLIKMGGYKNILELGSFIGVSTLFLAEAAGDGGSVLSFEKGEEFFELAQRNIWANGFEKTASVALRDAQEALSLIREQVAGEKYDFILLDCAKEKYGEMLEDCLALLKVGGLLVVDDVFMQGDVLNAYDGRSGICGTEKGRGVLELLRKVENLHWRTYNRVILPIGDGVLLVWKEK